MFYSRFPVAERLPEIPPRSVLINPYGNTITRMPELAEPYQLLFEAVSRDLASSGYSVYTNAPSDRQALLPDSRRLDMRMADLVPTIESFDFVITTFTGFMEAVMPTGVNLMVVVPRNRTRSGMALSCRHHNYWELEISDDTDSLAAEIRDLVASNPPAHSPPSVNRPEPSRARRLDLSADTITVVDTLIWSVETVVHAYRDMCDEPTFAEACASHPESPFAAYCGGMRLIDRRLWSEAAELLMRSYHGGCSAAYAPLCRALWAVGRPEAHETLLGLTEGADDPVSKGYLGMLLARGTGVEHDLPRAAALLRSAMKGGVKFAAKELFDVLWRIGTPEAYEETIDVASPLAEEGDGNAMGRLGRAYRDGRGVEKNLNDSAEWLRKAVEKNVAWGNELFDVLWMIGTPEAYAEAAEAVRPLADRGDRNALRRLSKAYEEGRGVLKDPVKAAELAALATGKRLRQQMERLEGRECSE